MKFRKLLPIILLSVGILAGCDNGTDTSHTVSIDNKEEITAAWHVGDPARSLELSIFTDGVEGNALEEYVAGHLTVVSSNLEVVTTDGFSLSALAAGTVTVTVKFYKVTDTVDLTISPRPTNKDKYGTVHEGTLADPFDNTDAVKVGAWTETNGNTPDELYVTGVVTSWYHAPGSRDDGAVSFYLAEIVAGEGHFEVYKCYAENGDPLTYDDIWTGGTIVAYGIITNYSGIYETSTAKLASCTGDKPQPQQTIEATVASALTVGLALSDGDSTYDLYAVTGYVVQKSGTNYWMADLSSETDSAKMIEIYNYSDPDGVMLSGAKITATMSLKNYHGTIENSGTPVVVLITAGTAWDINYTNVDVAAALTAAAALADNGTSTTYYKVTGVIVEVTTAYNATYGNISFTIGDTAEATELLTVYRLTVTAAQAETIVAGSSIVVGGQLQKYVNSTTSAVSLELVSGVLFSVGTVTPPAPEFVASLTLDFSTDYGISLDTVTVPTSYTIGSISYGLNGGKHGKNYSSGLFEYLMLYSASAGAFWNETAMTSAINRIRITTGSGASATAVYSLTVGTAVMASSQSQASATEAYVIGTGSSYIFDCSSVSDATYFNISAFTKNCQVAKLEIEFVA